MVLVVKGVGNVTLFSAVFLNFDCSDLSCQKSFILQEFKNTISCSCRRSGFMFCISQKVSFGHIAHRCSSDQLSSFSQFCLSSSFELQALNTALSTNTGHSSHRIHTTAEPESRLSVIVKDQGAHYLNISQQNPKKELSFIHTVLSPMRQVKSVLLPTTAQDIHHLFSCLKCNVRLQSRTNFKISPKLRAMYSALEALLYYLQNF